MSSNTKTGSASKIKMESFDDLFGGSSAQEIGAEQIINAPLADLHEFKDHPFKVLDDEKMEETTESIRLYGVLVPGIARPRADRRTPQEAWLRKSRKDGNADYYPQLFR